MKLNGPLYYKVEVSTENHGLPEMYHWLLDNKIEILPELDHMISLVINENAKLDKIVFVGRNTVLDEWPMNISFRYYFVFCCPKKATLFKLFFG
jgi:hypothetical protein